MTFSTDVCLLTLKGHCDFFVHKTITHTHGDGKSIQKYVKLGYLGRVIAVVYWLRSDLSRLIPYTAAL